MNPFTYVNPTTIRFGKGVIGALGETVSKQGIKRILLVYGQGSIKRNGVYDQVTGSLADAGIEIISHDGVQGNPLLSHVRAGVKKATDEKVDAVCAVGGGSVLDAAKIIAAGAAASCDVWDFFSGKAVPEHPLPLFTVLTLPATSSEMNGIAVLTNEETQEKSAIVCPGILNPTVSFMDPETTLSLSTKQTAFACTDILSHVMEAYFTTGAARLPMQDNLIEGVARGTIEAMDTIITAPDDYNARAAFMWAATLSWSGICQAGIPTPSMPSHALEMPLSAVYDVAHGAGLSVVIPAWIELAGARHVDRISRFFKAVFSLESVDLGVLSNALRDYYRRIGSPVTFAEAGVGTPDIDRLVELASRAFVQRKMTDYTPELIESIYRRCV